MKAVLLLEDGTVFRGQGFGAECTQCGEVVFNTAMSGYQEILTDPSYKEQIMTMTYPLIGNVGTNDLDWESKKVHVSGFVVKENCDTPSNWREQKTLHDYLKANKVCGIAGIDTRMLVKHIRTEGAMRGIISTAETNLKTLKAKLDKYPGLVGRDLAKKVSTRKAYTWDKGVVDVIKDEECLPDTQYKVVALDCGIKQNILRLLRSHGCDVTVVPVKTTAKDILAMKPDGVFLSNGPGDPAAVSSAIETTKGLLGKVPIFGICLGHQILSLALGGSTYKLKFGHRGANHPVKNMDTKAIEITSQNHGFCVDLDSMKDKDVELTHINLNDKTLEGLRCNDLKAFSVQYHPEASPGPHDSAYLFQTFIDFMKKK